MLTHHIFQAIYGTFPELHIIFCQCPCLVCKHILNLIKGNVEHCNVSILQINYKLRTTLNLFSSHVLQIFLCIEVSLHAYSVVLAMSG